MVSLNRLNTEYIKVIQWLIILFETQRIHTGYELSASEETELNGLKKKFLTNSQLKFFPVNDVKP
jgi:hypothetical protein